MPGLRHFAVLIILFVGAFVPPAAAESAHPPPSGEMVALEIVALDGEIEGLDVTAEHPFWVRDEGWIEAGDLLPGDELFTSAGGWARVSGATWAEVEVAVYNLDIEGWDSYFVGEGGYWVHNADCPLGLAAGGGQRFFRGARHGEAPDFTPRPNEFRVDPATGTVRPTHGVSVFDNADSVSSRGFVPHEVDQATVPGTLQIRQRGADPAHYEIMPAEGTTLTPGQFATACQGIGCRR